MPAQTRHKTIYPGVYFIEGQQIGTGKPELIYYIYYRKGGKRIEEKAGREFQNDMTPARANNLRSARMDNKEPTNNERRQAVKDAKEAEAGKWTISRLWDEYKNLKPQKKTKKKASAKTGKNDKGDKTEKPDYKSFAQDESRYEKYLKDAFADKEPKDLVSLDLARLSKKLSKTLKPQTVKHIMALLRRIIKFGVDKGLCNGAKFKIVMPSVDNVKTETLTPDQIKQLVTACKKADNKQAAALVLLALYTGMRRGELFKLEWSDINFENGFIAIREPKGGKTEKIPLNNLARELLENHPRTDSPFVFPGRGGAMRTDIKKAIASIRTDAKLPAGFRPLHGLRHVFASMLASSGKVDLYTIQKLLTHKSSAMTQRYAHLQDDSLKQASNVAGDMIGNALLEKAENAAVGGNSQTA